MQERWPEFQDCLQEHDSWSSPVKKTEIMILAMQEHKEIKATEEGDKNHMSIR